MLELLVPSSTAARLRQVRAHAELPAPLRNDLIQALRPPKLSGASAADVTQSSDDAPVRVPRRVLVDVAAWVREYAPDDALTLDALLRGAQIYFEPRPVYRRVRRCGFCLPQPPELEASLAAIRRAHEEAEFAQMSTPRDNKERECSAPYTFTSAVPRDLAVVAAEHQTWQETRSQLSAVINVIVSMLAVATAVWWGSGSASVLWVRHGLLCC